MADEATVNGYSQGIVVKVLAVSVFVFFLPFNPVLGIIAAGAVYKYAGDYIGGSTNSGTEDETVPWKKDDSGNSTEVGVSEYTDGPSGEVLTQVPEGMESSEQEYTVYLTSASPVTVELERSTPSPLRRLVHGVAAYLGYSDTSLVRRFYAETPRTVREEAAWRIRRDLDTALDTEAVPDGQFRCGSCTVEAADEFDGFSYSVEYLSEYVDEEN